MFVKKIALTFYASVVLYAIGLTLVAAVQTAAVPLGDLKLEKTGNPSLQSSKGGAKETPTELDLSTLMLPGTNPNAQILVDSLNFERYKDNLQTLSNFGDRFQGSASYDAADTWLEEQLGYAGYFVERHHFTFLSEPRSTMYVTKIGTTSPDKMYIVSAHLDGRGGGGAADDDGSGVSLVLEAARAFNQPGVQTDVSVRFIFWNVEELGITGSKIYVLDRAGLQGIENPPGSGNYPEPTWLGMIQHDMILFDHGVPPQPNQIPGADLDIEYQASSDFASESLNLAMILQGGNATYSTDYPAEIGDNMFFTDSNRFEDYTAAISVRENQRISEIGSGSNPNYHQPTDLYETYSEADFLLAFNALQMTVGTVAELAGLHINPLSIDFDIHPFTGALLPSGTQVDSMWAHAGVVIEAQSQNNAAHVGAFTGRPTDHPHVDDNIPISEPNFIKTCEGPDDPTSDAGIFTFTFIAPEIETHLTARHVSIWFLDVEEENWGPLPNDSRLEAYDVNGNLLAVVNVPLGPDSQQFFAEIVHPGIHFVKAYVGQPDPGGDSGGLDQFRYILEF